MFYVNKERCNGCRTCVNECGQHAIIMWENKAQIVPDKCISCGLCKDVCPEDAIVEQTQPLPDSNNTKESSSPSLSNANFKPNQTSTGKGLGRGSGRGLRRGPRDGRGGGRGWKRNKK